MIESILDEVERVLPMLEKLAVGRLIERTRFPKEGRKTFTEGQYTKEVLESFPFWRQCDESVLVQRIVQIPNIIASLYSTRDTRDVMAIHSMLTAPPKEYTPPVDKTDLPEGYCRNTGKPIYQYYRQNKKIPDRKEKDLCPCSGCVKLRLRRTEERNQYRQDLKREKEREKVRYEKYKQTCKRRSIKAKSFKEWKEDGG